MADQSKRIVKHAGIVTAFTLLSRILGAVRDLVLAHFFGAGLLMDAFVQAFTIPNVFRRLTAEGSMTLAFIPLYIEVREKQSAQHAQVFARQTLALILMITISLTALGIIFAPQLVYLFAAGFADDPEKFDLTVLLTRLMFPYLILVSLVAWAMGVLNSEQRFATPAAAPVFLNFSIIAAAVFGVYYLEQSIWAVAWGVVIGGVIQVLLQLPSLRQIKQSVLPLAFHKNPDIGRLLKLLAPSLLGVAVYQINIIVLRNIASFLPSGQVTHYYNASRLTELVLGVFAFAIATASFPELSQNLAQKQWKEASETIRFSIASTLFVILPASAGLIAIALPIVSLLYLHGAYTLLDVEYTANTLQAFAFSIPAVALVRLLVSVYYALKDTRTPVGVSVLSIGVTASLGWWWSQSLEVVGLAWGLTAGTWFQLVLLLLLLLRKPEFQKEWFPFRSTLTYLVLSSGVAAFAIWGSTWGTWAEGVSLWSNSVLLLFCILGSAVFYLGVLLWMKDAHALRWMKCFM